MDSAFFRRDAPTVARDLLGLVLVHDAPEGTTAGRIVETEAYAQHDPASHSYAGATARNASMFKTGGIAYVYRSYGIHWCFNVVVGHEGDGAAVLVRALEPIAGLDVMAHRRSIAVEQVLQLARGPGRLTQAMGITRQHDGMSLRAGALRVVFASRRSAPIIATPRIGISKAQEVPWRFCIADSPYVSGPRPRRGQAPA